MAAITEDYVSFETAKLLKEKGFPLPSTNFEDWVFCMYDENGDIQWGCYHPDYYCRVTLQMAMKWLREIHNIHIVVHPYTDKEGHHFGFIFDKYAYGCWQELGIYICKAWDSYEEAVESAIKYCLEHLI